VHQGARTICLDGLAQGLKEKNRVGEKREEGTVKGVAAIQGNQERGKKKETNSLGSLILEISLIEEKGGSTQKFGAC